MRACEETDRPTEEEGVDIGVAFCLSDRLGGRRTEGGVRERERCTATNSERTA